MSWLDDIGSAVNNIFGTGTPPAQGAALPNQNAQPPQGGPPSQQEPTDYQSFYNGLYNATKAQGYWGNVNKYGIIGALGQNDRDLANIQATAPSMYEKFLQEQAARQGTQIGNQKAQFDMGRLTGLMKAQGIDPSQFLAAAAASPQGAPTPASPPVAPGASPAPQGGPSAPSALSLVPGAPPAMGQYGQPQAQPPAGGQPAPAGGAPVVPGAPPVPAGQPAPGVNPVDAQRAFYTNQAHLYSQYYPDNPAAALEYTKLGQAGAPAGTVVPNSGPNAGHPVDGVTGQPINLNSQAYAAQGAGLTAGAAKGAEQPYVLGAQNNQAANQRTTDAAKLNLGATLDQQTHAANAGVDQQTHVANATVDAGNAPVTGFDKTTGQPVTTTKLAVAQGKAPNFVEGENPYFKPQQEELKTLRTDAGDADQGLQLAVQVQNAANGIYTGTGAAELQDMRKLAQAAASATGVKLPANLDNATSKFEQLKFASQQLVAKASHMLSPRIAQNIYKQIDNVKPGDKTSMQGLRDVITNEIIPALGRQKAMFGATADYYQKNPTKNDAAAVVPGQLNTSNFSVKTNLNAVQPGDYYMDPVSGNLRQRPVQ